MYTTSVSFDSVCVIESLPQEDLRTGRDLVETTLAPVSHADVGFVTDFYEAKTRSQFLGALSAIAQTAKTYGRSPILHLEAHGSRDGLRLADGNRVPWEEIAPRLAEINTISRMNLPVVAASCHGWYMSEILRPTQRSPAFGIIGTLDEVPAAHLYNSMKLLYGRLLGPGQNLREALQAANGGQEVQAWWLEMMGAELLLCRAFGDYVRSLEEEETQAQRVNRLVADIALMRNLDVVQTMQLRLSITEDLDDHGKWFSHYRTRFLMLDLFPENEQRFPLTYDDCMQLARQRQ